MGALNSWEPTTGTSDASARKEGSSHTHEGLAGSQMGRVVACFLAAGDTRSKKGKGQQKQMLSKTY